MSEKDEKYKDFIAYLRTLNLTAEEYERRVVEWCRKNKY